jgi:fibronectin-binding autotransporter adhesin
MKKLLILFCLFISSLVNAQTLPGGYVGRVQNNTANQWANYSFNFTATATGSQYVMFAFRQDPAYWYFDNAKLTVQGQTSNLLTNPNFVSGGNLTVNTANYGQININAPTAWGVGYQSGVYPSAAGTWDSSGQWVDGAVGSFDSIYQAVTLTAGVTYTITFSAMSNNTVDNNTVQLGVYAGQCSSLSMAPSSCTLPATSGFESVAAPSQTATTGCTTNCPQPPAPPPNWQMIRTSSSPVVISNIYPTSNNSPSNEGAANAFDGNSNTKYLNFDKQNAGVTVKLNQGRVVKKFTITTANDAVERDPASYKLYGSNDGVNWVLLSEGPLSLSNSRFTVSDEIAVANTNAYVYYFIKFPSIKNNSGNSVQVSEVTYYYDLDDGVTSTDTGTGGTPSNPGTAGSVCADCAPSWPATSDISIAQTAQKNAAKGRVANIVLGNHLYLEQKIGSSGNSVTIEQTGNYNKIAGIGGGTYAVIDGDNNTVNIKQGDTLGKNLIEFSITGNTNNVSIWQARNATTGLQTGQESGGHYMGLNITGSTNTLSLKQSNNGGSTSGHFAYVDVTGNNNQGTLKQMGNGEKTFFGIINGNTNVFDVTQQGSGSYFDLSLTGNGHNVTANQKDAGSHKATVNLTNAGGSSTVNLIQQGATAQNINITQQCATLSGCSVSVTQGQ